jgi:multiple sugar transport system substrate-binding protein
LNFFFKNSFDLKNTKKKIGKSIMKKFNYKTILLLSVMIFSMSAIFFSSGVSAKATPKSSAGVDLTIIVTDQQLPGVENVTDAFLASPLGSGINTVTVESSGSDAGVQLTTLSTALAAGSTDYDIVGIDVVWTALFASNGWIIPLDSYVSSGALDPMANFVPGMVDACTYNGHIYAYPYFMNLGILWYRQDLMTKYGYTASDFSTWEGLKTVANEILNNKTGMLTKADANLVGYVGQLDNYEGGVCNFFEVAGANGATDLISGNTVNIYPNSKLEDAMTFFAGLIPPQYTGVQGNLTQTYANGTQAPNTAYNSYIIPRNGLVMDEGSSIGKWTANESIFMRQWTFAYQSSLDAGMKFGIDFNVAPLPHFAGATNYATSCVGGAILSIPTTIDAAHRAAAINFTKYLGQTFAQTRELTNTSNFPALKSIYDSPPAGFGWVGDFKTQLSETLARPVEADYPLISSAISNDFSNILSGGKTVTQGLSDMQTNIEEILAGPPTVPNIPGYDIGLVLLASGFALGIIIMMRKRFK